MLKIKELSKEEQERINKELMSGIAELIEKKLEIKIRKLDWESKGIMPFMTIGFIVENEELKNSFSIGCMGWFSEELSSIFEEEYGMAMRLQFHLSKEEHNQIIESYKRDRQKAEKEAEKENPSYA